MEQTWENFWNAKICNAPIDEQVVMAEALQMCRGGAYQRSYSLRGVNTMLREIDYDMDCLTFTLWERQKTFSHESQERAMRLLRAQLASYKFAA